MNERDKRLAQLAARTVELGPDDALADAVMLAVGAEGTVDLAPSAEFSEAVMHAALFDSVAEATRDFDPGPGFSDAVLTAMGASLPAPKSGPGWGAFVRSGRAALVVAASLAAASVLYAGYSEVELDRTIMATVDSVEAE